MVKIFRNKYWKRFVVMKYEPGIVWNEGGEAVEFGCFVVNLREGLLEEERDLLATDVAQKAYEDVEIYGFDCQQLENDIDGKHVDMAIAAGVDFVSDDYQPLMTGINNEERTKTDIACAVLNSVFGWRDLNVVLVVGSDEDVEGFCAGMEKCAAKELEE
jgi:hypothetical protein